MLGLENVEIPPRFTLTTGGEEEAHIIERRDDFFENVRRAMGCAAHKWDVWFRVEILQLNYSDLQPTDQRIHLLRWDSGEAIAQLIDLRNDSNMHEVLFSIFPEVSEIIARRVQAVKLNKD